jgi:hypothetical protein
MKCPHCKKKIDHVNIYSECVQVGELKGKKIAHYEAVDEILMTNDIECPECSGSLLDVVEQ